MHTGKGKRGNEDSRSLEHELLIASVSLDQTNIDRIHDILENPLDWSLIIQSAIYQGILPLFCLRILSLAASDLPLSELELLRAKLQAHRQTTLRLTWKLVQCVEALSRNDIQAIILKGPILALQAFGDPNLRQFTDLDLLIHQEDFPKAYDLLVDLGYVPLINLDNRQKKYILRSDNHLSFKRQGDVIEIHWGVVAQENIPPLAVDKLWRDTRLVQLGDQEFHSLSLESAILYMCFHGAKHGWKQLKWIVDLAYLCRSCSENFWLSLLKIARQYGLFRQLSLGLLLAEDLVGIVLPAGVQDQINQDPLAKQLASQIIEGLFTNTGSSTLVGNYRLYMMTRERWHDRLRYILGLIFLPEAPDWRLISLPENLYFLYSLIRPCRLTIRGLKTAVISR